jgi:5'-3' exoribonuclease 2
MIALSGKFILNRENTPTDRVYSVHYDMPKSGHIHKSMLLRGVKFPPPALNPADIEATKGRAARSGRSNAGVPLQGDGRRSNAISRQLQ